jgi:hypothetical protein
LPATGFGAQRYIGKRNLSVIAISITLIHFL